MSVAETSHVAGIHILNSISWVCNIFILNFFFLIYSIAIIYGFINQNIATIIGDVIYVKVKMVVIIIIIIIILIIMIRNSSNNTKSIRKWLNRW